MSSKPCLERLPCQILQTPSAWALFRYTLAKIIVWQSRCLVIFFSLTEASLPNPTQNPKTDPKRNPKQTPKRSQTEPKRTRTEAKRSRNGPKSSPLGWDSRGFVGMGGGGGGGCKRKGKSLPLLLRNFVEKKMFFLGGGGGGWGEGRGSESGGYFLFHVGRRIWRLVQGCATTLHLKTL